MEHDDQEQVEEYVQNSRYNQAEHRPPGIPDAAQHGRSKIIQRNKGNREAVDPQIQDCAVQHIGRGVNEDVQETGGYQSHDHHREAA